MARDRDAFETLVEEHVNEIYRLAAAIVGTADASDVMQETFVTAWQKLGSLREARSFKPWLRRICVNRARNWLRTSRRQGIVGSLDHDHAGHARDHRPELDGAIEARAILEPAFERLSTDQRAVLALHYSLGYSIADAADALAIPVGTAKSRLNAGLRVLREALEPPAASAEAEALR